MSLVGQRCLLLSAAAGPATIPYPWRTFAAAMLLATLNLYCVTTGHCSPKGAGSNKPASAARPLQQAQHRMQGCLSSAQHNKASPRAVRDMQSGNLVKANSPVGLQLAALSAAHCYSYASLSQEATHNSMPSRNAHSDLQAPQAVCNSRNMSTWSSFLEHDHEKPQAFVAHLDQEDAWSDDGLSNALVTAVD